MGPKYGALVMWLMPKSGAANTVGLLSHFISLSYDSRRRREVLAADAIVRNLVSDITMSLKPNTDSLKYSWR